MHTIDAASMLGRRDALGVIAGGVLAGVAAGCSRRAPGGAEVVLYCSADDVVARPLVARFERGAGVRVLFKGDTEATKTVGLVERLRAERGAGRASADVFWSSEPFLTMALAKEGVLAPLPAEVMAGREKDHADPGGRWVGFAQRARMVVYSTRRYADGDAVPGDILSDAFTGSAPAIARPGFGTTRGHFAAVLACAGEDGFIRWLRRLKFGGARMVDGNSSVVRAVAQGESSLGLTDTDDIWAGQREGWPVAGIPALHGVADGRRRGPMFIPNTCALVAGGPNPGPAADLLRFLVSPEAERALMESDSHNMPVDALLLREMRERFSGYVIEPSGDPMPSLGEIARADDRSRQIVAAELGV